MTDRWTARHYAINGATGHYTLDRGLIYTTRSYTWYDNNNRNSYFHKIIVTLVVDISCDCWWVQSCRGEENAVQFSTAWSLPVGNQSSGGAKHALRWKRRSAQSKINLSDHVEYRERTLQVLFPESQWAIFFQEVSAQVLCVCNTIQLSEIYDFHVSAFYQVVQKHKLFEMP